MNRFRVAIKNKDGSFKICEVCAIIYRVDGIRVEYTYMSGNTAFIGQAIIDGENAIIEQSTGLTDKNGKEIFEGDICVFWNTSCTQYSKGEVVFHKAEFQFKIAADSDFESPFRMINGWQKVEIIGNIHEVKNERISNTF